MQRPFCFPGAESSCYPVSPAAPKSRPLSPLLLTKLLTSGATELAKSVPLRVSGEFVGCSGSGPIERTALHRGPILLPVSRTAPSGLPAQSMATCHVGGNASSASVTQLHDHPRYGLSWARAGGTSPRRPSLPYEVCPVMCRAGGGQLAPVARHSLAAHCLLAMPWAMVPMYSRCAHNALTMYSRYTLGRWYAGLRRRARGRRCIGNVLLRLITCCLRSSGRGACTVPTCPGRCRPVPQWRGIGRRHVRGRDARGPAGTSARSSVVSSPPAASGELPRQRSRDLAAATPAHR